MPESDIRLLQWQKNLIRTNFLSFIFLTSQPEINPRNIGQIQMYMEVYMGGENICAFIAIFFLHVISTTVIVQKDLKKAMNCIMTFLCSVHIYIR